MTAELLRLNLGCGGQRPDGWVNCDSSLASYAQSLPLIGSWLARKASVRYERPARYLDLRGRWPFADGSAAVVYGSHVFEHLSAAQATHFLAESVRVLAPGGVLRLVVPDLHALATQYLHRYQPTNPDASAELLYALNLNRDQAYPPNASGLKRWIASLQDYPHQHKAMYDQPLLAARVQAAGFIDLSWAAYGQSRWLADIKALECTAEGIASIYLEARRAA